MFKLSDHFMSQYRGKQPEWGYGDLSYVTYKRTYAKKKSDGSQEEFWETCQRVIESIFSFQKDYCSNMGLPWHARKAQHTAQNAFMRMFEMKWLPPGRGLEKCDYELVKKLGSAMLNNCAFVSTANLAKNLGDPFSWSCNMLMHGVGVGADTRGAGTVTIRKPQGDPVQHIISDDKEGWYRSVQILLDSYDGRDRSPVEFDYSLIREAGSLLKTFGGTASGPEVLKDGHQDIRDILDLLDGLLITSIAIVDIFNIIGRFVVAGGTRRSAEIMFGVMDDADYLEAKDPTKYADKLESHRWMSNNSVFADIHDDFSQVVEQIKRSGEPGFFFVENARHYGRMKDSYHQNGDALCEADQIGGNPCMEQILEDKELCTLVETFPARHDSLDDFLATLKVAYLYAKTVTLIPTHCQDTNQVMIRNRRIGLSQSGIQQAIKKFGSQVYLKQFCDEAYRYVEHLDRVYSRWLGCPTSFRKTTVKPSGCRPKHGLVTTNKGIVTLGELLESHPKEEQWYTVTDLVASGNGNKITKTFRNGKSQTIKITTRYNIELESTPNHQWFVRGRHDGHKLIANPRWVRADDLQLGDVIESKLGVYSNLRHAQLSAVEVPKTISGDRGQALMIQPSELNKDLSWLLGYLWGDGALSPAKYRIRFVDANIENLERCKEIITTEFGVDTPPIRSLDDRKAYTFEFGNRHLWSWIIENGFYKYRDNGQLADIPRRIRESAKEDVIAFIAGLIDADGCVSIRSTQNCLTIATAYDYFARHLQDIALACGLIFGRSLNTQGENKQVTKHIWLMNLALGSDISSCHQLRLLSNKMSKANGSWIFESARTNNHILGKITGLMESENDIETYDVEVENEHWYYAGVFKSHNTISLLAGATPGVHVAHSEFYWRTMRMSSNDALVKKLLAAKYRVEVSCTDKKQFQKAVCESKQQLGWSDLLDIRLMNAATWRAFQKQAGTVVVYFAVHEKNFTKSKSNISLWEQMMLVKELQRYWSDNAVSCTVTFNEKEAEDLQQAIEFFAPYVKSMSFLPLTTHQYKQAPYQECSSEEYEAYTKQLKPLNLMTIHGNAKGERYCNNDTCGL